MVKNFKDIFIRFDRMYERDRRTDGQMHRHRMTAYAALMHSIAWQKSDKDTVNRISAKSLTSSIFAVVRAMCGRPLRGRESASAV